MNPTITSHKYYAEENEKNYLSLEGLSTISTLPHHTSKLRTF